LRDCAVFEAVGNGTHRRLVAGLRAPADPLAGLKGKRKERGEGVKRRGEGKGMGEGRRMEGRGKKERGGPPMFEVR